MRDRIVHLEQDDKSKDYINCEELCSPEHMTSVNLITDAEENVYYVKHVDGVDRLCRSNNMRG